MLVVIFFRLNRCEDCCPKRFSEDDFWLLDWLATMSVSGACSVDKLSGMVSIREDATPPVLEWKAIDLLRTIKIALNSLTNLQATKDLSPKMILKLTYGDKEESIRLTFMNRPTMNNIKENLQTIVARHKTVIKDVTPGTGGENSGSGTPKTSSGNANTDSSSSLQFDSPDSLSDASLLKNLELQKKLLIEDKDLGNTFTQAVMYHGLSPAIFWSTRLNLLRTYALTISQHRGPYNVLSTIKPVASSDNQVNVTVTHDTIMEIFNTYPIIKKAYNELVPVKVDVREFWSRFFNSKLFRRLRGDKINNNSDRGDMILDKYLYIDQDFVERENAKKEGKPLLVEQSHNISVNSSEFQKVNKFLDLLGNEDDNSQKLGNRPDMTMRFTDTTSGSNPTGSMDSQQKENEMIILMKNMNKLSSKMINVSGENSLSELEHQAELSQAEIHNYEEELNIQDLNDVEDVQFIKLNIEPNMNNRIDDSDVDQHISEETKLKIAKYLQESKVDANSNFDLTDTYTSKAVEIAKTNQDITSLVKQNFRAFRLSSKDVNINVPVTNIVPEAVIQKIISFNITISEFLSHFWKIFLYGNQPDKLKKLFTNLKDCKSKLQEFKEKTIEEFKTYDLIKDNTKLQDKIVKDFNNCLSPLEVGLNKAMDEYIGAIKAFQAQRELENGVNQNGKRRLES